MRNFSVCFMVFVLLFGLISCDRENTGNVSQINTTSDNVSRDIRISDDLPSHLITTSNSPDANLDEPMFSRFFCDSCNSSSGSYVAWLNDEYYYISFDDDNRLYKCDATGENKSCIDDFKNTQRPCMTVVNNTLFYLRVSKLEVPIELGEYSIFFNQELCSYSNGTVSVISSDNILSYAVDGNYIFYCSDNLNIYRMNLDGTNKVSVLEVDNPMNVQVDEKYLYLHANESLFVTDHNGQNCQIYNVLHDDLHINGNEIYYIDGHNSVLRKTDDFAETSKELTRESIKKFCFFDGKIVYERFYSEEIVIYESDTDKSTVLKGKNPLVVNGHLLCVSENRIIDICDSFS